jgi:hypothetical protein
MRRIRSSLGIALLLLAAPQAAVAQAQRPSGEGVAEAPLYDASDPRAEPVTADNLLANDRFWPYHVRLTGDWRPADGRRPPPKGANGVLIRVASPATARVDFGRHGVHELPVAGTDLVEQADRVRRGELGKLAANLVLAFGTRLVDPGDEAPRPLGLGNAAKHAGFLCVFADPSAEAFAPLAASLAPLHQRHGVATILLTQGEQSDTAVAAALRQRGWRAAFVLAQMAPSYTRSLLDAGVARPAVQLLTPDGRLLFERTWMPEIVPELVAAIDASFAGGAPVASQP